MLMAEEPWNQGKGYSPLAPVGRGLQGSWHPLGAHSGMTQSLAHVNGSHNQALPHVLNNTNRRRRQVKAIRRTILPHGLPSRI